MDGIPRPTWQPRGMDDASVRFEIFRTFAERGGPPRPDELAAWAGGEVGARAALQRLHDAHAIVLDESGSIRMALPFSAVPTPHRVVANDRTWWANCAWDALAIPAALGIDARIEATWLDTGEPIDLSIANRRLSSTGGFVHFVVPARHWWDDIVET